MILTPKGKIEVSRAEFMELVSRVNELEKKVKNGRGQTQRDNRGRTRLSNRIPTERDDRPTAKVA
tara:strand:+ start:1231 stop:1425 length:195 start_codon:yes stop_codon:yes gene_type:complete